MSTARSHPAAFDGIAAQYDDLFTNSVIGRAQRNAVWDLVKRYLRPGNFVLELNCGTGEDALFLADCGMKVLASDISERMIEIAEQRRVSTPFGSRVEFQVLPIEDLAHLRHVSCDAAFSNFSGLNCVDDLGQTAADLSRVLKQGSLAILCFSNKYCLWEILWYLLRCRPAKAFRRWSARPIAARIGDQQITVRYPKIRQIVSAFAPWFNLLEVHGVGVTVPPSYLEPWMSRRKQVVSMLRRLDRSVSAWPVFRTIGDHVVLVLERTAA